MVAPDCLKNPTQITSTSPRPHGLLNSGLVVLRPSLDYFALITEYLYTSPEVKTFKFPDQDLLSAFYRGRWKPLPYIYNALKPLRLIHPRMWRDEDVKCVHLILDKPWGPGGRALGTQFELTHRWWWDQYEALEREMNCDKGDPQGWRYLSRYVMG